MAAPSAPPPAPPRLPGSCASFNAFENFDLSNIGGPSFAGIGPGQTEQDCCTTCLSDVTCGGVTFFAGYCYRKGYQGLGYYLDVGLENRCAVSS